MVRRQKLSYLHQRARKLRSWNYGGYVKRNQAPFVGAKEVYPEKYVWSSLDDIINIYKLWVTKNYKF